MPDHVPIETLTTGQEIVSFYLCKAIEQKATKNGQPYVQATLSDKTGTLDAKVWGRGFDAFPGVEAGIVVKVAGTIETYQDKLQLKVTKFRGATDLDGVDKRDLMRMSATDPDILFSDLLELVTTHVSGLTFHALVAILEEHREQLLESPAAMTLHHPYIGGLLEHTLSLANAAVWHSSRYGLNTSIMVGIAVLHDIGKLYELEDGNYSRNGRMNGHIAIGFKMAHDTWSRLVANSLPFTAADELERDGIIHGILSHHGSLEHGSPVVPCTKEAIAFHYLDMLDSRMSMFDEALRADTGTGEFTGYSKQFAGYLLKA
jgi:3'-5' exoribonuclease